MIRNTKGTSNLLTGLIFHSCGEAMVGFKSIKRARLTITIGVVRKSLKAMSIRKLSKMQFLLPCRISSQMRRLSLRM